MKICKLLTYLLAFMPVGIISCDKNSDTKYQGNYRYNQSHISFSCYENGQQLDVSNKYFGNNTEPYTYTSYVTVMGLSESKLSLSTTNPFYSRDITANGAAEIRLEATVNVQGNLNIQPRTLASLSFGTSHAETVDDREIRKSVSWSMKNVTVTYSEASIVGNTLRMTETYTSNSAYVTVTATDEDGTKTEDTYSGVVVTGINTVEGILE